MKFVGYILKKVISSIENGNQSKNGKRKYTRKSSIVLAKIKDFVQANPDATYPQIEAACGLGKNVIASSKTEVLEGMTLSDYVNICRVDPELLNKRKTNSF